MSKKCRSKHENTSLALLPNYELLGLELVHTFLALTVVIFIHFSCQLLQIYNIFLLIYYIVATTPNCTLISYSPKENFVSSQKN